MASYVSKLHAVILIIQTPPYAISALISLSITKLSDMCKCGRQKVTDDIYCDTCLLSNNLATGAKEKKLTDTVLCALKPVMCIICDSRFAGSETLLSHQKCQCHHVNGVKSIYFNPWDMIVHSLKEAFKIRGFNICGNKNILKKRSEEASAGKD